MNTEYIRARFSSITGGLLTLFQIGLAIVMLAFGALFTMAGFFPESFDQVAIGRVRDALSESVGLAPDARGDYLNFLIGLPLAFAGSLIALLIASSTRSVAQRQAAIAATDLVDRKISTGLDAFRNIVHALDRLYWIGRSMRFEYDSLMEDAKSIGAVSLDILLDLPPEGLTKEQRDKFYGFRDRYLQRFSERMTSANEKLESLTDCFQHLSIEPFWALSLSQQTSRVDPQWSHIIERLHDEAGYELGDIEGVDSRVSPRAVGSRMARLSLKTRPFDMAVGYYLTPHDATPIETIGAMIELLGPSGNDPQFAPYVLKAMADKAGGRTRVRLYNFGAASIITLFDALCSEEALRRSIRHVVDYSHGLTLQRFFALLPDKRLIANRGLSEDLVSFRRNPARLIYEMEVEPKRWFPALDFPTRAELGAPPLRGGSGERALIRQFKARDLEPEPASAQGASIIRFEEAQLARAMRADLLDGAAKAPRRAARRRFG